MNLVTVNLVSSVMRLSKFSGDVPASVETFLGGVARLEPVGSGCRIHIGEQRHGQE